MNRLAIVAALVLVPHLALAQMEGGSDLETPSPGVAETPPEGSLETHSPAASDASTRRDFLNVEIAAGTTAPLDVWVGANLVLGRRLVLSTSLGRSVYGGIVGNVVESHGGEEASTIVEPLFSNAWVFRLGVGIRPFGDRGPEAVVGYARLRTSATWDADAFGLPSRFGSLSANVGINAIYLELGWTIDIGPVFLRPAIGWTHALGSSVRLSATNNQVNGAMDTVREEVAGAIDTYGMTPTLSLSLGARF